MVLDLVLCFVLVLSSVRGYQRGLASKLIGVAGIMTSYVASAMLYKPLGDVLRDTWELPPLVAYGGGGMAVFFVVSALFGLADRIRRSVMQRHMVTLTLVDRLLGAALGFFTGSVYALLVLFLAFVLPPDGAVAGMLQTPDSLLLARARPMTDSLTAAIAGKVMGDGDLGRVVGHTLTSPGTVAKKTQSLMASPRLEAVLSDRELMEKVRKGELDAAMRDSHVQDLFADRAAKEWLQEFTDNPDGKAADADRRTMLKMLSAVERFRSMPVAQQILADPEIQAQLRKGDIVSLMRNKKLGQLLTGSEPPAEERQP
ncbi:MAG: CvpA family protein [Candidatus Wallbacteria bacterium]|nr:CvpA family protein [Candidatus Wallbacteria bacterium]